MKIIQFLFRKRRFTPPSFSGSTINSNAWWWFRLGKSVIPAVLTALAFLAIIRIIPLPARLNFPPSVIMEYNDGKPAHFFLSTDEKWRLPVNTMQVDTHYLEALIRFEDKRFYRHCGFDPLALLRALYTNLRQGKIISGASTITMQLVRMIEPRPRTYFSKIIELLQAVQVEARLTKKEILTAYLQFLPFGKNIEGVESAAYAYFGHSARALSNFEIAFLLSVPWRPYRNAPHPANYANMKAAVAAVGARLEQLGYLSKPEKTEVINTPLPQEIKSFPRQAPHCAYWLKEQYPDLQKIITTLDAEIQKLSDNILNGHRQRLGAAGIHNAAIVILDSKTSEVRALTGNFDFWDTDHQGQVTGFTAMRSPGSTLKPFLYALAMDKGLVLPSQLVEDIPVSFGNYVPQNFENKYHGLISLEEALSLSLNIPFINLLSNLKLPVFINFLTTCGITSLNNTPDYYGLSVAVGGLELRLIELTNLYTLFSREGKYLPYKILADENQPIPLVVLSKGSTFLTRSALMKRDRPDFPQYRQIVEIPPSIFWKTGTSQGHKDAWAIGGNREFTIGIWTGNFDATPSLMLEGTKSAVPVLFDLLAALANRYFSSPFSDYPPPDLKMVEVCSFSGALPNNNCPKLKAQPALFRSLPKAACPYHINYLVDKETGYALPPTARTGRSWEEKVFVLLPPGVRRWITDRNLIPQDPPPLLPGWHFTTNESPPEILLPRDNTTFFLISALDPSQQEIPLEANTSFTETEIQWFVDGKFLKTTSPAERTWLYPEPGRHKIRVLNSAGKYDEVTINIMHMEQMTGID